MIVTIDGPAASGKSSAAYLLARRLDFYYINSGLLFRALAYLLTTHAEYSVENVHVAELHDIAIYLDNKRFKYFCDADASAHVYFDDNEITSFLKNASIDQAASIIGTNLQVRNALLKLQRNIATSHNVVAEGRDSGTAVFPHADIKFFLTASVEKRAQRIIQMQKKRGVDLLLSEAIHMLQVRDQRDSNRSIAPLTIPEDGTVIDNSNLTQDETINLLQEYVKKITT